MGGREGNLPGHRLTEGLNETAVEARVHGGGKGHEGNAGTADGARFAVSYPAAPARTRGLRVVVLRHSRSVTAGFIRTVVGSEVADRPEIKDYASDRLKRRQREAEKKKERDKAAAEKTARLKKERFGRKKAPGKPRKVVIMDKDAYEAEQTAREAKSPKS